MGDSITLPERLTVIDRLTSNEYIPPTRSTEAYWVILQRQERRPFQPHFDEAVRLVQAKSFRTMSDLAKHFGKAPRWSTELKTIVLRHKVMSLEEWRSYFAKRSIGCPIQDTRTYEERQPVPEPTPLEDEPSGFSIDGIEELIGACLARLRRGEFCDENALRRFYGGYPYETLERFRNRVIEHGLVESDADWQKLFVRFQKRRALDVPTSWSHLALDGLRGLLKTREEKERESKLCAITATASS